MENGWIRKECPGYEERACEGTDCCECDFYCNNTVKVYVRSFLSCDGYECKGQMIPCYHLDELKSLVGDDIIIWEKGKNTFAGDLVSDEFMDRMIKHYYRWVKKNENNN